MISGNMIGGTAPIKTVKIVDEDGAEILGVVVDQEVVFTATDNDVREGMVYASDGGVSTGSKIIPTYVTSEGHRIITSGSAFETTALTDFNLYDFTKLQAIICPWAGSLDGSVGAEKVAINDGVYAVNSTELLATVTKDSETQKIKLGITNDSDSLYLLRYFTYKEVY